LSDDVVKVRIVTPDREIEAEVPYQDGMVLLDALRYVREEIEPDLTFMYSCRNAQCGTCAVMVDGKPALACDTPLKPGDEITVEPLKHVPVVEDLMVDWTYVTEHLRRLAPVAHLDWFRRRDPEEAEVLHELRSCIECLCCVAACPVISAREGVNPGPTVLRKLAEESIKAGDTFTPDRGTVYGCTCCHTCEEVCPKDIEIPGKAVETVRARLREEGRGPLDPHDEVGKLAVETGRSVTYEGESFLERYSGTHGEGDLRVMFFTGCLVDYRLPHVGEALVRIAEELGFELVVPESQVCCGSPLFRTGQRDRAEKLAFRNLEAFNEADPDVVVTLCAGCGATLKNDYPEVLGERFEWEVMDVTELLVHELKVTEEPLEYPGEIKVTYHDPCHLKRAQGVWKEPRRILKAVRGVEFVEMKEPDRCCGAGGGVRSGMRDLARLMADVKAGMVEELGVDVLTTVCPFCEYNLREAVDRRDLDVEVPNLTEIVARALQPHARG